MDISLQKADIWKRISAFLCDAVCIIFLSCALALLFSWIFNISGHNATMNERKDEIITEAGYNVKDEDGKVIANPYPSSNEELEKLSEEEKAKFQETEKRIRADDAYAKALSLFINLLIIIITASILISFLIFEFLIPLLLKNGQTVGKKVFGVAVMRADGVKIPTALLFLRAIVCKFTLETMVPVMALLAASIFQYWVPAAAILTIGILALQVILFLFTKEHTPIHDVCTYTVAVDMGSQKIFNSVEEKAEYIAKIQRERAEDERDY